MPTMNRPRTQSMWSLSCSPMAKNIYPIVRQNEMLTSSDLIVKRSITTARIKGAIIAAKDLMEK